MAAPCSSLQQSFSRFHNFAKGVLPTPLFFGERLIVWRNNRGGRQGIPSTVPGSLSHQPNAKYRRIAFVSQYADTRIGLTRAIKGPAHGKTEAGSAAAFTIERFGLRIALGGTKSHVLSYRAGRPQRPAVTYRRRQAPLPSRPGARRSGCSAPWRRALIPRPPASLMVP
jgi:hypothetical protein